MAGKKKDIGANAPKWEDLPEIPKEEQPWPLPEGWKWVKLGNVITISNETVDEFTGEEIYIGLENLEKNGGLIEYGDSKKISSMKNVFHDNAILYGKLRPYLNKHYVVDMEGICSTDISVFYAKDYCLNKFVNCYFDTNFFIEYAVNNSKGINLPRVSPKVILNIPFPYPHLETQQRIVTIIESLFSKLDEAAAKVQAVIDGHEARKQAILHKAFIAVS